MQYVLPGAVLLLMLATGMSLEGKQFIVSWKRLTTSQWAKLLLATFLIPPLLALGLGAVLPIELPVLAGLFLVAVAPGAPLMSRNAARRGFDLHQAASYQMWSALLAPLVIPPLVAGAAWLYGRTIWISPGEVLRVVVEKQFLPLLAGMALMYFAPAFSIRIRRPLNIIGNVALTVAIIGLLIKVGPALETINLWIVLAALLLAGGCLVTTRILLPSRPTLAISNVNRHVGLAVLLSSGHFANAPQALPAIAAYAVVGLLVIIVYARWSTGHHRPNPPLEHA